MCHTNSAIAARTPWGGWPGWRRYLEGVKSEDAKKKARMPLVLALIAVWFSGCDLSVLSGMLNPDALENEEGTVSEDKGERTSRDSAVVLLYRPGQGSAVNHDLITSYEVRLYDHEKADNVTVSNYRSGDRIRDVAEGNWSVAVTAYAQEERYATGILDDQTRLYVGKDVTPVSFSLVLSTEGENPDGGDEGAGGGEEPGDGGSEEPGEEPIESGGEPGIFVTKWDTRKAGSSASNQITLPFVENGNYDVIVDWGDGNSSDITSWNDKETTHSYATGGVYTVKIYDRTGRVAPFTGWSFGKLSGDQSQTDARKLLEVKSWERCDLEIQRTTSQVRVI